MGIKTNPNFPSYASPTPQPPAEQIGCPVLVPSNINFPYAPRTASPLGTLEPPPTNDEIPDVPFGVQIGSSRFPTLRSAMAATASLVPQNRGLLAIHGSNAVVWNHSMVNRYPYYNDGHRTVDKEQRWQWVNRIVNSRNQMGIIRRQEPLGMDLQRADEAGPQSRKRRVTAMHKAGWEDTKHKRKIDPNDREFDAKYAAIWRAQQSWIRTHNAHQRAIGLQKRRAFDLQHDRPVGPDPQVLHDGGNDLYDFAWDRQQCRAFENGSTAPQQHEKNIEQERSHGSYDAVPRPIRTKSTRCTQCKKHRKGCNLRRCRARNYVCEGCEPPRVGQKPRKKKKTTASPPRERRPAEPQSAEPSSPGSSADLAWLIAQGFTPGPGREFQDVASRLLRRGEAPPRPRSASPQRGALFSDRCDNCQLYSRFCEDTPPCSECMDRNLVCNVTYMDNPFRSPRTDEGSEGSGNGWGSFGQAFGGYRGGSSYEDMNDPDDLFLLES